MGSTTGSSGDTMGHGRFPRRGDRSVLHWASEWSIPGAIASEPPAFAVLSWLAGERSTPELGYLPPTYHLVRSGAVLLEEIVTRVLSERTDGNVRKKVHVPRAITLRGPELLGDCGCRGERPSSPSAHHVQTSVALARSENNAPRKVLTKRLSAAAYEARSFASALGNRLLFRSARNASGARVAASDARSVSAT